MNGYSNKKLTDYEERAETKLILDKARWSNSPPETVAMIDPFEPDEKYRTWAVPVSLAELVQELWTHDVKLFDVRQETNKSACVLEFGDTASVVKFFELVIPDDAQYRSDEDRLGIFADRIASDDRRSDRWTYELFPFYENGAVVLSLDVTCPPSDIPLMLETIRGKDFQTEAKHTDGRKAEE